MKYKISDVADVISEREENPSRSNYDRFVGLEHYVSGDVVINNYGSTEKLESAMKVFKSGDILIARRNVYLKRASVVFFDGLTSGDSIVLRPRTVIMGRLLPFIFNTIDFWDFADKHADGTMSKRLSPKTLMEYEFQLSGEAEPDNLANLLWAATETKEAYKKLLVMTDELVKSQFIEMLKKSGISDESYVELQSVCTRLPQNGIYKKDMGKLANARIAKMKQLFTDRPVCEETGMDDIFLTAKEMDTFRLTKDDLLFGRRSIVEEGAGKCSLVGEIGDDVVFESSILRITLDTNVTLPIWLFYWFKSNEGKTAVKRIRNVVTIAGIKGSDLKKIRVPVIELELQNRFAEFVQQADKSKFELQQTLNNFENMISSLLHTSLS